MFDGSRALARSAWFIAALFHAACADAETTAPVDLPPASTLEAHELDPRYWEALLDAVRARKLPVDSVLVAHKGAMVGEAYFGKQRRETLHDLRSATKSITSLLVGIALDRGVIRTVDEAIAPHFVGYAPGSQTVRDLLTMRTGLDCDDWKKSPGHEERMYDSDDWLRFFFEIPAREKPGEVFSYCTAGVVVLGELVARASRQTLPEFAREALFERLQIGEARWKAAPRGVTDAGGHLMLTPVSMLKIGMMVAAGGIWNGKRIVSEEWLQESTRPRTRVFAAGGAGPEYGYLWWLEPVQEGVVRSFQARGNGGQYVMVLPQEDLVVVYTGHAYDDDVMMEPFRLTSEFLVPMARRTPFSPGTPQPKAR